jgi:hypothetical protein
MADYQARDTCVRRGTTLLRGHATHPQIVTKGERTRRGTTLHQGNMPRATTSSLLTCICRNAEDSVDFQGVEVCNVETLGIFRKLLEFLLRNIPDRNVTLFKQQSDIHCNIPTPNQPDSCQVPSRSPDIQNLEHPESGLARPTPEHPD